MATTDSGSADSRTTVKVMRSTRDALQLVAVDMAASERQRLTINDVIKRLIDGYRAAVAGKAAQ